MDKVTKALRKMKKQDFNRVLQALEMIRDDNLTKLDVVKMRSFPNHYRVRVGQYRIIFEQTDQGNVIHDLRKRDEQTYRNI